MLSRFTFRVLVYAVPFLIPTSVSVPAPAAGPSPPTHFSARSGQPPTYNSSVCDTLISDALCAIGTCPRSLKGSVPHRAHTEARTPPTPTSSHVHLDLRLRSPWESPEAPPCPEASPVPRGFPCPEAFRVPHRGPHAARITEILAVGLRGLGRPTCLAVGLSGLGWGAVLTCASSPLWWSSRLRGSRAPCTPLRARTSR